MIPKKYKLSAENFKNLLKIKKTALFYKSDFFIIRGNPNNLNHGRFGVVISKKAAPKATQRNKVKRIIYKKIGQGRFFNTNSDVSITVSKKAAGLPVKELENKLQEDFTRVFKK